MEKIIVCLFLSGVLTLRAQLPPLFSRSLPVRLDLKPLAEPAGTRETATAASGSKFRSR